METFIKVTAGVLIALTLGLILSGQRKEMALLLSVTASVMTLAAACLFFEPIISFLKRLQAISQLDTDLFNILLKAVGMGLLAELVGLICSDAGNGALGKALQILASGAIVWLSLPLFEQLMKLVDSVLGAI